MKIYLEILLITIAVVILMYLVVHFSATVFSPTSPASFGSVCFGEKCFQVESAKTQAQIEKGLMNRNELGKDNGMLFVFSKEGIYPFWMKSTLIPLDMIWINGDSKVVFIGQNVQPCKSLICPSVVPTVTAKYVLEVNAGLCQQMGLKVGDELKIENN